MNEKGYINLEDIALNIFEEEVCQTPPVGISDIDTGDTINTDGLVQVPYATNESPLIQSITAVREKLDILQNMVSTDLKTSTDVQFTTMCLVSNLENFANELEASIAELSMGINNIQKVNVANNVANGGNELIFSIPLN